LIQDRATSTDRRDREITEQFAREVLAGLGEPQKQLPCKYLYDERGSQLFDRICELDEYYLTRTELEIMERSAGEMAAALGSRCFLVEYGSGSSIKTRLLLDQLDSPSAYVPVDISGEHLHNTAARLESLYPDLNVLPVCADFTTEFTLPECDEEASRRSVYFPGSTIGNFAPEAAASLLKRMAAHCGSGNGNGHGNHDGRESRNENGGVLIGVDLKKDRDVLERAYNDRQGVTEAFNLNLLQHINRELGADFRVDQFEHRAFYNERLGRVEMHLVSLEEQTVTVDDFDISFEAEETIHTESCYKYSRAEFETLAQEAGLAVIDCWTDAREWFSVQYLEPA